MEHGSRESWYFRDQAPSVVPSQKSTTTTATCPARSISTFSDRLLGQFSGRGYPSVSSNLKILRLQSTFVLDSNTRGIMGNDFVKKCGNCGELLTAEDFWSRPELVPIGMMFIEDDTTMAFYMFQHETDGCHSCLVVPVIEFQPFLKEPLPEKILALSECCERHCVKLSDLTVCKQPCFFAPYRRFLLLMIEHKRGKTLSSAGAPTEGTQSGSDYETTPALSDSGARYPKG
jgi:hypothetical protein